jgi:subfamily B ATP-binding cassette protein MsbA
MHLFIRFLRFVRPYRWRLLWALFLVFVSHGLTMPIPWITKILIDRVPAWAGGTPEEQAAGRPELLHLLFMIIGGVLVLHLLNAMMSYVRAMALTFIGNRVLFDVRSAVYRHLQRLSMRYYESRSTGHIMARVL